MKVRILSTSLLALLSLSFACASLAQVPVFMDLSFELEKGGEFTAVFSFNIISDQPCRIGWECSFI